MEGLSLLEQLAANPDHPDTKRLKYRYEISDTLYTEAQAVTNGVLQLEPFQNATCTLFAHQGVLLIADEPGLGKTVQGVALTYVNFKSRVLVVCPASVQLMWMNAFKNWWFGGAKIVKAKTDKPVPEDADIVVVSYESYAKSSLRTKLGTYDTVIYDEAHNLSNPFSGRGKAYRVGHLKLVRNTKAACHTILLSATPLGLRPIHLWNLIAPVAPEVFAPYSSYYDYGAYFCKGYFDRYGEFSAQGSDNLEELNFRLRSTIMVRRKRVDASPKIATKRATKLIPLVFEDIEGTDEKRLVEKEEIEFRSENVKKVNLIDFGINLAAVSKNVPIGVMMGKMVKERINTTRKKMPLVIKSLQERMRKKEGKIFIVAIHKEFIDQLYMALKEYHPLIIDGSNTLTARHAAEHAFQEGTENRIVIGNVKAAGVGITLTAADEIYVVEPPYTTKDFRQVEDRINRIGQKKETQSYIYTIKDSLEEYFLKNILAGGEVSDSTLDKFVLPF